MHLTISYISNITHIVGRKYLNKWWVFWTWLDGKSDKMLLFLITCAASQTLPHIKIVLILQKLLIIFTCNIQFCILTKVPCECRNFLSFVLSRVKTLTVLHRLPQADGIFFLASRGRQKTQPGITVSEEE